MEINEISTLGPTSQEIINEIFNSSAVQEKINGCAEFALKQLYPMYTMTSRAAAYELKVGEETYRVIVNFSISNLPFAVDSIKVLDEPNK
jgi:hypothetical protein